ncbi:MAG: hypothetical protein JSS66_02025 [Armatimonadetes bacterium]|nr:hypothetical protein [Armatimonadota bacterium]
MTSSQRIEDFEKPIFCDASFSSSRYLTGKKSSAVERKTTAIPMRAKRTW